MNKLEQLITPNFPFEVFGKDIHDSMKHCAKQYNIPLQYMGLTALFTLAGLSGAMYIGEANGGIKTILYGMIIGPSGVGKTPAYKILCGNIIKDSYTQQHKVYEEEMKVWKMNERIAHKKNEPFEVPKPVLPVRMAQSGTPEGFLKKAAISPCGFGVYYDEGGDMKSINKYNGGGDSNNFWNKLWNGDPYLDIKVDEDRERYVSNPSISMLVGIQTNKVKDIITADGIESGIASRMLIVESDYIQLDETVEPFGPKAIMCERWVECIRGLHNYGLSQFTKDTPPTKVQFDINAKHIFTKYTRQILNESNTRILSKLGGNDPSVMMISYSAKLSAYFGRFCLLLSILDNYTGPIITSKHVENAFLLYQYFFKTASSVLTNIFTEHQTGLNDKQRLVMDQLPGEFTAMDAKITCQRLNLSPKYFESNFAKGVYKNYIRRKPTERGKFERL